MNYNFLALKIKYKYLVDLATSKEKEMIEAVADLLGVKIEDALNTDYFISELASFIEDEKLITK